MVMPGDNIEMTVELGAPIVLSKVQLSQSVKVDVQLELETLLKLSSNEEGTWSSFYLLNML